MPIRRLLAISLLLLAACATRPVSSYVEPQLDPRWPHNAMPESAIPAESVRLHESGEGIIAVWVREDGTVGDAGVIQSIGHPRLDEAALNWYTNGARYLPAMQDGKPIAAWKALAVKITY